MTTRVDDLETFRAYIGAPGVTIVKFTATWCGPCQKVAPYYESLARAHGEPFLNVDVDANPEATTFAKVRAMPTFQAYRAGERIGECVGGDHARLDQLLRDAGLAPAAPASRGEEV